MRFWVVKRPNNVERYVGKFSLSTRSIANIIDVIEDMVDCRDGEVIIKVVGADKLTDVLSAACTGGMLCDIGDVVTYHIRKQDVRNFRDALFHVFIAFKLLYKINIYYKVFNDPIYVEVKTKCGDVTNKMKLKVEL